MNLLARQHLEERLFEAVQLLLQVGDPLYLEGLSPDAFLEATKNELRFLGFYAHNDSEIPHEIHAILEENLDKWHTAYNIQQENALSTTQPLTPETKIQILAMPWIQTASSKAVGLLMTKATQYIGFMLPMERLDIQMSLSTT